MTRKKNPKEVEGYCKECEGERIRQGKSGIQKDLFERAMAQVGREER